MADIPEQDIDPGDAPDTRPPQDAPGKPKPRLGSLRALWPFVMRQKGLLVAWLVALAASSTATLSLPLVVRRMIDHGFSGGGNVNATFALVFAVALALAIATAARFFFVSLLGERVVADLREVALHAPFEDLGTVHAALTVVSAEKLSETFDPDGVRLVLRLPRDSVDTLKLRLRDATRNRVRIDDNG